MSDFSMRQEEQQVGNRGPGRNPCQNRRQWNSGKVDKLSNTGFYDTHPHGRSRLLKTPVTPPNSSGITSKLWSSHPNSKLSHSNPSSAINRHKLLFNALLVLALSPVSSQKLGFFFIRKKIQRACPAAIPYCTALSES